MMLQSASSHRCGRRARPWLWKAKRSNLVVVMPNCEVGGSQGQLSNHASSCQEASRSEPAESVLHLVWTQVDL